MEKPNPELEALLEQKLNELIVDYYFGQGSDEPYGACLDPYYKKPAPKGGLASFILDNQSES